MADEYRTETNQQPQQSQQPTHTTYVTQQSGWSTFWKWAGTIIVVLLIAMVVIYVANTFLLGESMRTQAISDANNSDTDSTITLDIGGGDGDGGDAGGESSSN